MSVLNFSPSIKLLRIVCSESLGIMYSSVMSSSAETSSVFHLMFSFWLWICYWSFFGFFPFLFSFGDFLLTGRGPALTIDLFRFLLIIPPSLDIIDLMGTLYSVEDAPIEPLSSFSVAFILILGCNLQLCSPQIIFSFLHMLHAT